MWHLSLDNLPRGKSKVLCVICSRPQMFGRLCFYLFHAARVRLQCWHINIIARCYVISHTPECWTLPRYKVNLVTYGLHLNTDVNICLDVVLTESWKVKQHVTFGSPQRACVLEWFIWGEIVFPFLNFTNFSELLWLSVFVNS